MSDPTPEEVAQIHAFLLDESLPSSGRGSVVQVRTDPLPIEEEEDRIRSAVESSVGNHAIITGGSLGSTMIPLQELQQLLTKHVSGGPNEEPAHSPKWEFLQRLKEKHEQQARDLRTASEKPKTSPEWQEILPPINMNSDHWPPESAVGNVFSGWGPCPEEGPTDIGEPDWVGEILSDDPAASDPEIKNLTVLWPTAPDVSHHFPMESTGIPLTGEYTPTDTTEDTLTRQGCFLVTGEDMDRPPAVKTFPVVSEEEEPLQRKEGRVGTIKEFAQMRQEREKELFRQEAPTPIPTPAPTQAEPFELLEYTDSAGSSFFMLAPNTQQQWLRDSRHLSQGLEWVRGPVWAAIHKMTGWPKEKIQALDVRVRMVPPL